MKAYTVRILCEAWVPGVISVEAESEEDAIRKAEAYRGRDDLDRFCEDAAEPYSLTGELDVGLVEEEEE